MTMKTFRHSLHALILICFTVAGSQAMATAPESFADLAEDLLPTVVNISSIQKSSPSQGMQDIPDFPEFPEGSPFEDFFEEFFNRRNRNLPAIPASSLGSGFVIDAEQGYIVTNNHVIRDADEVRVTLHNDDIVVAEVIGHDDKTDLALIKIDPEGKDLKAANFGDSDVMRVGDWVIAIGNPFGLGGTVTSGIVSARQRDIQAGPYDDFIQTDASINRGNSGGPMFNLNGEVIGINTAIFSPSGGSVGIGFAIPSSLAKPVIDQLKKYGRTRRGWLGVKIQTVTDEIAESLGIGAARGALVADVTTTGPAEEAGIVTGDIILSFNGSNIDTMRELPRIVAETDIDSKVPVEVWRDGKTLSVTVTLGELEKAEETGLVETGLADASEPEEEGTPMESLALTLMDITPAVIERFGLPEGTAGVLVTDVKDYSDAAQKGVAAGDLIIEVNQQKVGSITEIGDAVKRAQENGKSVVLLQIKRNDDTRFVAVKLTKQDASVEGNGDE